MHRITKPLPYELITLELGISYDVSGKMGLPVKDRPRRLYVHLPRTFENHTTYNQLLVDTVISALMK